MHVKRTTIILVVCAVVATWFAAAMTPGGPPAAIRGNAQPTRLDIDSATLASEVTRLRERLRPDTAPRERIRNPFAFRSGPRPASPEHVNAAAAAPIASQPNPSVPPLTLAGFAEDSGPDGLIRTAIISGGGQLFLVKRGDTMTTRDVTYRVEAVSSDGVDLTNLNDTTSRRLTLK